MSKQFNAQFKKLFKGSDVCLRHALNQKYKAVMKCDNKKNVVNLQDLPITKK